MNCNKCGNKILPKRIELLPNTKTCVSCSDTQKKGGLTVMKGTGDNTWIETIPMEQEEYQKIIKAENKLYIKSDPFSDLSDTNINIDI